MAMAAVARQNGMCTEFSHDVPVLLDHLLPLPNHPKGSLCGRLGRGEWVGHDG